MIQKNQPLESKDFNIGLFTKSNIFSDADKSPNCMDIKWFFDGSIGKRMGSSTTNTIFIGSTSAAGWTIDSTGTLTTSLQSYWKLDEFSGNRADSFDGVTLFDKNTTGTIVGIRGQAALMVALGSTSLISPTLPAIETGNINFSLSTWVYRNSTSLTEEQTIVSKRDPDVDAPTVLLLHCDGVNGATTFPDSSPSSKTVTAVGDAQVSTSSPKFGTGSLLLDGTGDYITLADSSDWNFADANFTIEMFVKFSSLTGAQYLWIHSSSSTNYSTIVWNGTTWSFAVYVSNVDQLNTGLLNLADTLAINTWYHVAIVRNGSTWTFYRDGVVKGTTTAIFTYPNYTDLFVFGTDYFDGSDHGSSVTGNLDEIRVSNGVARYVTAFTPPPAPIMTTNYEYWLYINTNQQATFRVSANGSSQSATVQASNFGALNTATWYNVVAFHSNNAHIGITVNTATVNTAGYTGGVRVGSAPFTLGGLSDGLAGVATSYLDARIDETGFWKKILTSGERLNLFGGGTGNTYSAGASGFGWAMFDFGASSIRWLTVAAGTGIVASSNLGTTFVTVATSRTQTYQYMDRSKNVVIMTSDAYDPPLYWAGSATTFANTLAPNSAPLAKYNINYQGFLILLNFQDSNGTLRKRGFSYADENLQLTSSWGNSFDIPSSADDEITASFILSKFLYVSTRYKLFRVAYVGGNPDWAYQKVKDWGFVPRTVKLSTVKGSQVAIGMDWQHRIRVFDGYDDLFVTDNVENDNGYCDFAMNKISYAGSGLIYSHAEFDYIEQEYRLNLVIGTQSTNTTHAIVLNGRTMALYPYSNQQYQAMCVAESNNQQHLMAVDRSGFVHILNSGNMDVSLPISEYYDSPFLYKNTPTEVTKSQQLNFYFNKHSSGTVYHQDRVDFSSIFGDLKPLRDRDGRAEILGTESSVQIIRSKDVPSTFNAYQFRITSSSNTFNNAYPWELSRWELLQQQKGYGKGA